MTRRDGSVEDWPAADDGAIEACVDALLLADRPKRRFPTEAFLHPPISPKSED